MILVLGGIKMLQDIEKLKDINMDAMVRSMIKGDRSALDYARGFEDALINIELLIKADNYEKLRNSQPRLRF